MIYVYIIKFLFFIIDSTALHIAASAKLSGPPDTATTNLLIFNLRIFLLKLENMFDICSELEKQFL